MTEIHFITSNAGKIASIERYLRLSGRTDIKFTFKNLDLPELQADTVDEVSAFKARRAFEILKAPVAVEDGGLSIEELKGFPGVYTRYVIDRLGAAGLLKLMEGKANRRANFTSTVSYIDAAGELRQFQRRGGEVSIAETLCPVVSPIAWSELWQICHIDAYGKTLAEMTPEEFASFYQATENSSSISLFIHWLTGTARTAGCDPLENSSTSSAF